MATIALYADKVNQMPGLINDFKLSVTDYKSELSALRTKTLTIDRSICNLDSVISSLQTSSQTQEQKVDSLDSIDRSVVEFIEDVVRVDSNVADVINKRKDDFYKEYYYLKPDIEKNGWDKAYDWFVSAAEWLEEHWRIVVTVLLVIAAVVVICTGFGGILAPLLLGIAKGLISGVLVGSILGGITSLSAGGSFWEGIESGAFTGALAGASFGALGGAGVMFGSMLGASGGALSAIRTTMQVSGVLSIGMTGFDLLAWGIGLFNPLSTIVILNQRLHSNTAYNAFQFSVSGLAAFSYGTNVGIERVQRQIPVDMAKSGQGKKPYPGVDDWKPSTLKKGDCIVRGEPNGTDYFTTPEALNSVGNNKVKLFEGLQVAESKIHGYRPEAAVYQVKTSSLFTATADCLANPSYGMGGLPQTYVPNADHLIGQGILELLKTVTLD